MAFKNLKKNVVLLKYNGVPTATDNITMSAPVSLSPSIDGGDIDEVNSTFGSKRSFIVQDGQKAEFDIEIPVRSNVTDTAPEISEVLKSGLINNETIDNVLHEVTYETDSANDHFSTTIEVYEDEEKYTITGAVSNITISGKMKEYLKLTAAVKGFVETTEMSQVMPVVTNDNNDLLIIDSITGFTSDGSTVNMESFSFDMQNEIVENYTVDVREYTITDFDPKLEITALKIKNVDVWTPLFLQTLESILITVRNGSTSSKALEITIPKALCTDLSTGDLNGQQTTTKTYRAQNNLGDDNFKLVWKDI